MRTSLFLIGTTPAESRNSPSVESESCNRVVRSSAVRIGKRMRWKSFGRTLRWLGPISVLLAGLWVPARAQSGSAAPSSQRNTSTPYTGDLSIFDAPGRDERLQINRVMDMLGIAPGKSVADVGAGSGWFTMRAAKRVGADGMVY